MADEALTFPATDGRVTLLRSTIIALVEAGSGCVVLTKHGSHKVATSHDAAREIVWPRTSAISTRGEYPTPASPIGGTPPPAGED